MPSPPRNLPRIPRSHSYSHPEPNPQIAWYAEHLEYARLDLHSTLSLLHSSPALPTPKSPKFLIPIIFRPRSPPPAYESYDDYHYIEAVPNLELHSAAAEGNVGLVHYALTHGQPINSILHGLQPIHAAAAGGSLSALRMLIDRGADVNAPRLPRRYSSEKSKDAPSVGVAGATPLHFAAANGHAQVVQLLLTNGAVSDKADQMGQTPEGLAEENGHAGVLDVLRVYDSLRRPASSRAVSASMSASASDAVSIHSGRASFGGPSRPTSPSASIHDEGEASEMASAPSRKGKERAHSSGSDHSSLFKMRKSIGGFLGRRSRKSSLVMSPYQPDQVQERPSMDGRPISDPPDTDNDSQLLAVQGAENGSTFHGQSPFVTSPASSHHSLPDQAVGHTVIHEHEPYSAPPEMSTHLARTASSTSNDSHNSLLRTPPQMRAPPRERKASHSSRRPSLPSIFEKAVHPGQAFRAAIRNHRGNEHDIEDDGSNVDGPDESQPRTSTSSATSGFFVRGRQKSGDQDKATGGGRRYTSKGIIGLFRRPQSPPSRSPSPPMRDHNGAYPAQVDPDELNKEIEKLRTAKFEMEREREMERRHSYDEGDDGSLAAALSGGGGRLEGAQMRQLPKSAPATKTRFFENLDWRDRRDEVIVEDASASAVPGIRKPNRSRTGSEVIAPSPLANEWPRESSDSDSTHPGRVRRVKTEGSRQGSAAGPSRLSGVGLGVAGSTAVPSPRATKQRSATLPSSPGGFRSPLRTASGSKLVGVDWDEGVDLRSGVLIRESVKKREEGELSPILPVSAGTDGLVSPNPDGDEDTGDEEFHDAVDMDDAAMEATMTETRSPTVQVVRVEDPVAGTIELASPPKATRRFRGASIGSVNSVSSRLSAPGSSVRFSGGSDDGSSERHARFQDGIKMPPPPLSIAGNTFNIDTRPRGKSVSSVGTTTTTSGTGSGYQYSIPLSTPGTSVTPPSTISITVGAKAGFPPVPEHGVAPHHGRAANSPTFSNDSMDVGWLLRQGSMRKEDVEHIVRQAEDGVLHIAQMPESSESSRDLAAQLAAFGESVALQEEMARQERRERRERRKMYRAMSDKSRAEEGSGAGESEMSVRGGDDASTTASSRSTQRTPSMLSTTNRSLGMSHSGRSESFVSAHSALSGPPRIGSSSRDMPPPPILVNVEAPKSSVPGINSIYDRRAALYRENMAKLSAAQGLSGSGSARPSSGRHHSGGHRPSRYSASEAHAHVNAPRGAPAWLTGATPTVNRETGSLYGPASHDSRRSGPLDTAAAQRGPFVSRIGSSVRSRSRSGSAGNGHLRNQASTGRPDLAIISSSLPPDSLPLVKLPSPDSPRRLSHKHTSPRKGIARSAVADASVPIQPLILTRQSQSGGGAGSFEPTGRIVSSPTDARSMSGRMSSLAIATAGAQGEGTAGMGKVGNGHVQGTEEVAVIPAQSASYTLPGPSGKGRSLSGTSAAVTVTSGSAGPAARRNGKRSNPDLATATQLSETSSLQPKTRQGVAGGALGAHTAPSSLPHVHPLKSTAPAISIFNHRFTGPHDGGDSDDSSDVSRAAAQATARGAGGGYMVIENDWRGGRVLEGAEEGKKKWGLKGLKPRRS